MILMSNLQKIIAVIDDDPGMRASIAGLLSAYEYTVKTFDLEAPETKTIRPKEKIAKLKEELRRLHGFKTRMLAAPDQQISLTDPDSRSMATMHKARILLHD
jgi:hypothetical protein